MTTPVVDDEPVLAVVVVSEDVVEQVDRLINVPAKRRSDRGRGEPATFKRRTRKQAKRAVARVEIKAETLKTLVDDVVDLVEETLTAAAEAPPPVRQILDGATFSPLTP